MVSFTSKKKVFIETYGCQMNFSDTEIVARILREVGYQKTDSLHDADLILLNTCAVREKAEQTVRNKLAQFGALKRRNPFLLVGVLGCMAGRLKEKFFEQEKVVDMVVGPDAYRDMPRLIQEAKARRHAVNVQLSREETYGDIEPVRLCGNGVSAFVSAMRGCDNMCTYCVVPFTRGRERSRDPQTILSEVRQLQNDGYKEVTLLGQNIDSYLWYGGGLKKDFKEASEEQKQNSVNFAALLQMVAEAAPGMRIRFLTSNPHDMTEQVLRVIASHDNICRYIHLPVQSGSTRVLKHMKRGYTREEYLALIDKIREILPDCAITMDMISGYPTETEQDHQDTLSVMEYVRYYYGYMFKYSERPGTYAALHYPDDVTEEVKQRRLEEVIALQGRHSSERNQEAVGKVFTVLVEGASKKDENSLYGRNGQSTVVVFNAEGFQGGDFVDVLITDCTQGTLIGQAKGITQGAIG